MDWKKYIKENMPFTFVKYGDGEYLCSIRRQGQNCDNTKYTEQLGSAIVSSYIYLASLSNSYLGKWTDDRQTALFFEELIKPQWVDYCSFLFGKQRGVPTFMEQLPLLKCLKNSSQQKIYVCNEVLTAVAPLFNIDKTIIIHPYNWFQLQYDDILQQIKNAVKNPNEIIIMTSAGMGAKPLLADLRQYYPSAILIDIGSGFDALTSTVSRSYNNYSLEEIETFKRYISSN